MRHLKLVYIEVACARGTEGVGGAEPDTLVVVAVEVVVVEMVDVVLEGVVVVLSWYRRAAAVRHVISFIQIFNSSFEFRQKYILSRLKTNTSVTEHHWINILIIERKAKLSWFVYSGIIYLFYIANFVQIVHNLGSLNKLLLHSTALPHSSQ